MLPLRIECSNSTYEKLQRGGIDQRAREFREDLSKIFLYKTIWECRVNKFLNDAKKGKFGEDEKRDVISLEKEVEGDCVFRA